MTVWGQGQLRIEESLCCVCSRGIRDAPNSLITVTLSQSMMIACLALLSSDIPHFYVLNTGGTYGASLWRMPPSDGALEKLADLPGHQKNSVIRKWVQQSVTFVSCFQGKAVNWSVFFIIFWNLLQPCPWECL